MNTGTPKVTGNGAVTAATAATASLKRRNNTSLVSKIKGSLTGKHKNPAKHETLEIMTILRDGDADRYPQAVSKGDETLAYLKSEEAPLDERNPYYTALLESFVPVIRDRIAKIRGNLTSSTAEEHEQVFEARYSAAKKAYIRLSVDMMKKKDTKELYDMMLEASVASRRFYSVESADAKAQKQKARNQQQMAKSTAVAASLQARLNALRGRGGAGSRKLRSRRATTRKLRKNVRR